MLRGKSSLKAPEEKPDVSIKGRVFAAFANASFRAGCKADFFRHVEKRSQNADFSKKAAKNTPVGFGFCRICSKKSPPGDNLSLPAGAFAVGIL